MEVTKWTYWQNTDGLLVISGWKPLCSVPMTLEEYLEARQAVVDAVKENNFHFSGDYHQHGDFGAPVLDDKYIFLGSERDWGAIMADAYPDEDYTMWDERAIEEGCPGQLRYVKWAFTSSGNEVITPYTKRVKVSDNFSYSEEKSPFEDDIIIYNSDGCSWCNGVGTNPNDVPCGECANICKEYCPARKLDDDTPEFIGEH